MLIGIGIGMEEEYSLNWSFLTGLIGQETSISDNARRKCFQINHAKLTL